MLIDLTYQCNAIIQSVLCLILIQSLKEAFVQNRKQKQVNISDTVWQSKRFWKIAKSLPQLIRHLSVTQLFEIHSPKPLDTINITPLYLCTKRCVKAATKAQGQKLWSLNYVRQVIFWIKYTFRHSCLIYRKRICVSVPDYDGQFNIVLRWLTAF